MGNVDTCSDTIVVYFHIKIGKLSSCVLYFTLILFSDFFLKITVVKAHVCA